MAPTLEASWIVSLYCMSAGREELIWPYFTKICLPQDSTGKSCKRFYGSRRRNKPSAYQRMDRLSCRELRNEIVFTVFNIYWWPHAPRWRSPGRAALLVDRFDRIDFPRRLRGPEFTESPSRGPRGLLPETLCPRQRSPYPGLNASTPSIELHRVLITATPFPPQHSKLVRPCTLASQVSIPPIPRPFHCMCVSPASCSPTTSLLRGQTNVNSTIRTHHHCIYLSEFENA